MKGAFLRVRSLKPVAVTRPSRRCLNVLWTSLPVSSGQSAVDSSSRVAPLRAQNEKHQELKLQAGQLHGLGFSAHLYQRRTENRQTDEFGPTSYFPSRWIRRALMN